MIFTILVVLLLFSLPLIWPVLVAALLFLGGPSLIPEAIQLVISMVLDDFRELKRHFLPVRKNLAGEIILVTGGGRGIGRLMALDFASKNAIVVIWDKQGAEEVAGEIKKLGKKGFGYTCDLSKR
eukprot:EG_transcript_51082